MKILNYRCDGLPEGAVYVGRPMKRYALTGSPLGNPYKVGPDGTREEVLWQYENILRLSLNNQRFTATRDALDALTEDSVLVCWCAPLDCHGDIIEKVWRERQATKENS